jgi:hypothetical protein
MAKGRPAFWAAAAFWALTSLPAFSQSDGAQGQPENESAVPIAQQNENPVAAAQQNESAAAIAQQCIDSVKARSSRLKNLVKQCGEGGGAWKRIVQNVVDAQLQELRGGQNCKIAHRLEGQGVVKLSGRSPDPQKTLEDAKTQLRAFPGLTVDISEIKIDDCLPKIQDAGFDFPLEANGAPRLTGRGKIDSSMAARLPGLDDCKTSSGEAGPAAKAIERVFEGRYNKFWIADESGYYLCQKRPAGKWDVIENVANERGILVLRSAKE